MIWISGTLNLTGPGTKPNSPLAQILQLAMFHGALHFDFKKDEARDSEQFMG